MLVYFMRPPDLQAFGTMRPSGASGPGGNLPPAPLSVALYIEVNELPRPKEPAFVVYYILEWYDTRGDSPRFMIPKHVPSLVK